MNHLLGAYSTLNNTYLLSEGVLAQHTLGLGLNRGFQEGKLSCHLTPAWDSPGMCQLPGCLALPTAISNRLAPLQVREDHCCSEGRTAVICSAKRQK